ncbi:MAG: recombinase family protein, partial [Oscillospiraceae bacterium]
IALDNAVDDEKMLKDRLAAFRKLFESGDSLTEFDPDVFKTVVEEVVLGGYNEDGTADPYMMTV